MIFEDLLDSLKNNGYDILEIVVNDNPYVRIVKMKDSAGNVVIKKYKQIDVDVTDANGNVIGVDEDWIEV